MELEPKYVDVCVKRWEDYTGRMAELIRPSSPAPEEATTSDV
jgi:DNA modification methylase